MTKLHAESLRSRPAPRRRFLPPRPWLKFAPRSVVFGKLDFDSRALAEARAAAERYAKIHEPLGDAFADELQRCLGLIEAGPQRWPREPDAPTRRVLMRRFPFKVVYLVAEDERAYIVAVAHQHQKPNYWADRIE